VLTASVTTKEFEGDKHDTLTWCLWLLIFVGLGTRVIYAFINSPLDRIYLDALMEYNYAKALPHANLFDTFLASGYPRWLKAELFATGENRAWIGLITAVMSAATPWIWYRWMREHFRLLHLSNDELLATIGFLILTWLPSWISIYSLFMPECLLLPLVGTALWLCSYTKRTDRTFGYVGAAALWAAAYMTKASMLLLAVIEGVWLLRNLFGTKYSARSLIIGLSCTAIFSSAYLSEVLRVRSVTRSVNMFAGNTVLNSLHYRSGGDELSGTIAVTGDDGTVRKEGFNLKCPSLLINAPPLAPLSSWHTIRHGETVVAVDYTKPVGQQIPKLPLTLAQRLQYTIENAAFLIFGPSWPDCVQDDFIDVLQVQTRWAWAPLLVLAAVLAIRQKRTDVLTVMCFVPWIFFIFQEVYITEGRFRKPLEGILIAECIVLIASAIAVRRAKREASAVHETSSLK
jgi:hypothetical protein